MTKEYLYETCEPDWNSPEAKARRLVVFSGQELGALENLKRQRLSDSAIEVAKKKMESTRRETRFNQKSFRWITDQRLRYSGELHRRYQLYSQKPEYLAPRLEFHSGATFVEASWKKIEPDQKDKYYAIELNNGGQSELWGMVGFHVSTKLAPNWIWLTWEHVDNPNRYLYGTMEDLLSAEARRKIFDEKGLCEDASGGSKEPACRWMNYELNGVQTSFLDNQGRPVRLGNSVFETSMPNSSCMSCHARSSIGAGGTQLDLFHPDAIGAPDPRWFAALPLPNRPFMQLDFVNMLREPRPCKEICYPDPSGCPEF